MNVGAILARSVKEKRLALQNYISSEIPGFDIKSKATSTLWAYLSKFIFWNKEITTSFTTTLYPVVWVPSFPWHANDDITAIKILAHEYVHLHDRRRLGLAFNFLYITPQIFSLAALLAPYNFWCILFLVFLLPIPSPGRAWLEFRGYRMTMAVHYWFYGVPPKQEWILRQFVSSNYYWMFPLKGYLSRRFNQEFEKIQQNDLTSELEDVKIVLGL